MKSGGPGGPGAVCLRPSRSESKPGFVGIVKGTLLRLWVRGESGLCPRRRSRHRAIRQLTEGLLLCIASQHPGLLSRFYGARSSEPREARVPPSTSRFVNEITSPNEEREVQAAPRRPSLRRGGSPSPLPRPGKAFCF